MNPIKKYIEESERLFEEKVDNYYINRLAMHEGRAYIHFIVDKTEIKSFLLERQKGLLEVIEKETSKTEGDLMMNPKIIYSKPNKLITDLYKDEFIVHVTTALGLTVGEFICNERTWKALKVDEYNNSEEGTHYFFREERRHNKILKEGLK